MQINYISPINKRPFTLKRIVTLYQKSIPRTLPTDDIKLISSYDSFVYIENGYASVTVGDNSFIIEKAGLIFIPPSVNYSVNSANGMPITCIFASFINESPLFNNLPRSPIKCNEDNFIYLRTALENADILTHTSSGSTEQHSTSKGILSNLYNINVQIIYNSVELFLLCLCSSGTIVPSNDSQKRSRHANITANIEEYLKARVTGKISLEETAQNFGYSVSNIQKIFKSVTGQSIIMYFNKLKLEEAKKLIIEDNMSFTQISTYLSFSNPNYFSRIFKNSVGMTPTEFAALQQKEHADGKKTVLSSKNV